MAKPRPNRDSIKPKEFDIFLSNSVGFSYRSYADAAYFMIKAPGIKIPSYIAEVAVKNYLKNEGWPGSDDFNRASEIVKLYGGIGNKIMLEFDSRSNSVERARMSVLIGKKKKAELCYLEEIDRMEHHLRYWEAAEIAREAGFVDREFELYIKDHKIEEAIKRAEELHLTKRSEGYKVFQKVMMKEHVAKTKSTVKITA